MKSLIRRGTVAPIVAFAPAVAFWVHRSEMTHLWWIVPGAVVISLFLLGCWYLVCGAAPGKTRLLRFGLGVLAFVLTGFVGSRLIRYEGSTSGSSYPKFSWVWQNPAASVETTTVAPVEGKANLAGLVADQDDFLGPDRDGMWDSPTFGTDWITHPPELLWRRPIGKGWSSFVVSGDRALTQQQVGDEEQVVCIDLASGAEIWNYANPQTRLLLERAENGGAAMGGDGPRATPTIHEGRVYAVGGTGIVNCLDLATGQLHWTRHFLREFGKVAHRWGMANSPLVLPQQNLIVFTGPDEPGPTLIACDPGTGETRWTYTGSGASYSSPRLVKLAGREQIVSVNYQDVCGLDPATGDTLWTHSWPGTFPKVGQPIVLPGDRLLVTASYGVGSLLLQVKRGENGKFSVEQLWKSTYLKTKFSSAAVIGEHAYGLDEGRLACIDLATGKRVWKNEKFGFGQHLFFGNWLLVQAESGEVVLGTVGPERFTETGRIAALSSMTWNTPVVAGRILLVRNDQEAACYLLPK